jgi:hypothetical protein
VTKDFQLRSEVLAAAIDGAQWGLFQCEKDELEIFMCILAFYALRLQHAADAANAGDMATYCLKNTVLKVSVRPQKACVPKILAGQVIYSSVITLSQAFLKPF